MKYLALLIMPLALWGCDSNPPEAKKQKENGVARGRKANEERMSDPEKEESDQRIRKPAVVQVAAAAFSPNSKLLLLGFGQSTHRSEYTAKAEVLKLMEVPSGREVRTFPGHRWGAFYVAFFPDGKKILSAGIYEVRIWDVASGKLTHEVKPSTSAICVCLSNDGTKLLTKGGFLRLWDAATGKLLSMYEKHKNPLRHIAISPNGDLALLGCVPYQDNGITDWTTLQLYDLKARRIVYAFGLQNSKYDSIGWPFSFSQHGTSFISGTSSAPDKCYLVLRETKTGKAIRNLEGTFKSEVFQMNLTPDGKAVLAASRDGTLRRWEVRTGKEIWNLFDDRLKETTDVFAFSPNGKLGFSGGIVGYPGQRSNLHFWNTEKGTWLDAVYNPDVK